MKSNTQTHTQYSIPLTNQFQALPSLDFRPVTYAQASIKHPSSSTQTSSLDLSKYFTKHIRNHVTYSKYREPQSLFELNQFVKATFLPYCSYILDSPLKT